MENAPHEKAETHVLSALRTKQGEITRAIADMEDRIRQSRADLAHIEAAIRLFKGEPPKVGTKNGSKEPGVFGKGEISRRVRETLRFAKEPLSAEEIARAAMVDKGLSVDDGPMRRKLNHSFLWALHRMHVAGAVQKVGHGLGARWRLPQ